LTTFQRSSVAASVERAAHDELARPTGARSLGHDQTLRELADAIRARLGNRLEVVDVHPAGEELTLGPPHQGSRVGALHLLQACAQLRKRALLEEVQGRVVQGDDRDGAVTR
jgi:hypothetical protein